MRFDQGLEHMMGYLGPEMKMYLKPKAVVLDYLRTDIFMTSQCVCIHVS